MFKRLMASFVILCFNCSLITIPQAKAAESILNLPIPGTMVNLSPAYEPALIKGLTVHKDNPFLFDFIVDTGHSGLAGGELQKEGDRLVKYFFACLTIPEKDLWVNLSPYEKDRMVPQALGQTALGRDLLAQDYILKQLTASLIYPEKNLGKEFWDRVYAKAQAMYGTTQIPVNTFNKVWIMADKADVYENGQSAFVLGGHLKVMLEEDYLALQKHAVPPLFYKEGARGSSKNINSLSSQIVKKIILPEIEKEVNTGKNFSTLRQIFNSLILASWYKKNLKEALLTQVYADKSTVNGVIASTAKQSREQIYQQYLKAYKKGVFNYIKEDPQANGQTIPRKYFSGGFDSDLQVNVFKDNALIAARIMPTAQEFKFQVGLGINSVKPNTLRNAAMTTTILTNTPDEGIVLKSSRGNFKLRLKDGVLKILHTWENENWKGVQPVYVGPIRSEVKRIFYHNGILAIEIKDKNQVFHMGVGVVEAEEYFPKVEFLPAGMLFDSDDLNASDTNIILQKEINHSGDQNQSRFLVTLPGINEPHVIDLELLSKQYFDNTAPVAGDVMWNLVGHGFNHLIGSPIEAGHIPIGLGSKLCEVAYSASNDYERGYVLTGLIKDRDDRSFEVHLGSIFIAANRSDLFKMASILKVFIAHTSAVNEKDIQEQLVEWVKEAAAKVAAEKRRGDDAAMTTVITDTPVEGTILTSSLGDFKLRLKKGVLKLGLQSSLAIVEDWQRRRPVYLGPIQSEVKRIFYHNGILAIEIKDKDQVFHMGVAAIDFTGGFPEIKFLSEDRLFAGVDSRNTDIILQNEIKPYGNEGESKILVNHPRFYEPRVIDLELLSKQHFDNSAPVAGDVMWNTVGNGHSRLRGPTLEVGNIVVGPRKLCSTFYSDTIDRGYVLKAVLSDRSRVSSREKQLGLIFLTQERSEVIKIIHHLREIIPYPGTVNENNIQEKLVQWVKFAAAKVAAEKKAQASGHNQENAPNSAMKAEIQELPLGKQAQVIQVSYKRWAFQNVGSPNIVTIERISHNEKYDILKEVGKQSQVLQIPKTALVKVFGPWIIVFENDSIRLLQVSQIGIISDDLMELTNYTIFHLQNEPNFLLAYHGIMDKVIINQSSLDSDGILTVIRSEQKFSKKLDLRAMAKEFLKVDFAMSGQVNKNDKAMDSNKLEALNNTRGGIDLNTANMGMTVTKDANGGVQVTFDPAMIARIKAQGIWSADPIIIRVTPLTPAQIRPLLGLTTGN